METECWATHFDESGGRCGPGGSGKDFQYITNQSTDCDGNLKRVDAVTRLSPT